MSIFNFDCSFKSGESDSQTNIASGRSAYIPFPQKISSINAAIIIVFPAPVGAVKDIT